MKHFIARKKKDGTYVSLPMLTIDEVDAIMKERMVRVVVREHESPEYEEIHPFDTFDTIRVHDYKAWAERFPENDVRHGKVRMVLSVVNSQIKYGAVIRHEVWTRHEVDERERWFADKELRSHIAHNKQGELHKTYKEITKKQRNDTWNGH